MRPTTHDLSVLVVDDSAVARQVIGSLLTAAGMRVQSAHDPLFALQKLARWEPDVVVLDLEMPRMDGLTFLRRLRRERQIPVVVCSGTTEGRGSKALQALEEGAIDVVLKPRTGIRDFLFESAIVLVDAVAAAAESRAARARPPELRVSEPSPWVRAPQGVAPKQLIAIGASTGGPDAIRRLLGEWPEDAPPTVVVQHMPAGFTNAFAKRLSELSRIEVREAVTGDVLQRGLALIAPGGRHLVVRSSGSKLWVEVLDGPLVSRHRPSVDTLFESVAEAMGKAAVAAILTGMGDDGARGMLKMREAGAATLAQDEASSVVFGMPKAAVDYGSVLEVASLDEMARAILRHCQ